MIDQAAGVVPPLEATLTKPYQLKDQLAELGLGTKINKKTCLE